MNRKSGSGLFLMEMIVAVFFFVVCASTCILAFAKADSMSRLAKDQNGAVIAAQSAAEIWKAEGLEGLAEQMGLTERAGESGSYGIAWDTGWQVRREGASRDGSPAYEADVRVTGDGLETIRIAVSRYGEDVPLFELEASRYLTAGQREQEGQ